MVFEGDKEGMRMAANQVYYKSLRGLKNEEYKDSLGAKSYAKPLVSNLKLDSNNSIGKESKYEWQIVSRKKNKIPAAFKWATVFVAKIPLKAKV